MDSSMAFIINFNKWCKLIMSVFFYTPVKKNAHLLSVNFAFSVKNILTLLYFYNK